MCLLQFSAKNTEGNYTFYMKNHAKSASRSMAFYGLKNIVTIRGDRRALLLAFACKKHRVLCVLYFLERGPKVRFLRFCSKKVKKVIFLENALIFEKKVYSLLR